MDRKIFTIEQKNELLSNKNILKVSNSNVQYTKQFKERALHQHNECGIISRTIFENAGIPRWLNKTAYAQKALERWGKQKIEQQLSKKENQKQSLQSIIVK